MSHMFWAGVAAVAIAASAFGQRTAFYGDPTVALILLRQPSVQEELKLTAEQAKTVHELDAEVRKEVPPVPRNGEPKEVTEKRRKRLEAVTQMLQPAQLRRLKQIDLQLVGPVAWMRDANTADLLGLTEVQRKALDAIRRGVIKDYRALPLDPDPETMRKRRAQELRIDRTARKKVLALLTPAQQAKWAEETGEPFHGNEHVFDVLKGEPTK